MDKYPLFFPDLHHPVCLPHPLPSLQTVQSVLHLEGAHVQPAGHVLLEPPQGGIEYIGFRGHDGLSQEECGPIAGENVILVLETVYKAV